MLKNKLNLLLLAVTLSTSVQANNVFFQDNFERQLDNSWQIMNENKTQWNIKNGQLNALVQGAGLWANMEPSVNNLFVHTAPEDFTTEVDINLEPENAYEQASFGLYQDPDNYIKLCKEMFENKLSLVFVSEKSGKPTVIKRIDYTDPSVRFRLQKKKDQISAYYKDRTNQWVKIGDTKNHLKKEARITLLTLFGDAKKPKWAQFDNFMITKE
jgi:regulation of enolase protein 1 (concanavalin A-like superfamily)